MIFNNDAIPLLDYKNGDLVTADDMNTNAIKVFTKFNGLHPGNVGTINTATFYDSANNLYYVNYCGMHYVNVTSGTSVRRYEPDILINNLTDDINKVLSKYKEV